MKAKEIAILVVFVLFVVPTLFGIMKLTWKSSQDPGNITHVEEGVELMAESAIPWWLGILEWLAGLPGIIGAVLIIGLIYFLKWIGEIK